MTNHNLPAHLRLEKGDKNHSKADLEKMVYIEEKLKGNNNLLDEAPDTLSELGKEYYYFIVKELTESGIISNLDIPILTLAADCLEKMQLADEVLNKEGLFVQGADSRGNTFMKENVAVKTKQAYANQFRFVAGQLGMSPSSRAQMAQANVEAKVEEAKPLNKLMEKKNQNRAK